MHRDVRPPRADAQDGAGAARNAVIAAQSGRQRRLVERTGGTNDDETVGKFRSIAEWAVEDAADVFGTSFRGLHPCSRKQRRSMSNVLAVKALEFGDEVSDVVLPKADDLAIHDPSQSEVGQGHTRRSTATSGKSSKLP